MPYKNPEDKKKWEQKNRVGKRKKIWWGYVFLDSAPEGWEDKIRESGMEAVWAVHDKDKRADGSTKNAHAHVALRFTHAVPAHEAKEELAKFGVMEKSVQYRDSWRAVCRYMIHMDDPDKFQYDEKIVRESGGADWHDAIVRTCDTYKQIREMKAFCKKAHITSFATFSDWCDENNEEWSNAICDKAGRKVHDYINSLRYDKEKTGQTPKVVQDENGEWVQAVRVENDNWMIVDSGEIIKIKETE